MKKVLCSHPIENRLPSGRCSICSRENYLKRRSRPDWVEKQRRWVLIRTRKSRGQPEPTYGPPKVCECCGGQFGKKGPCLDHCHETGVFRGWLCTNCNLGIGHLGDSIESLEKAVAYLRRTLRGIQKCA